MFHSHLILQMQSHHSNINIFSYIGKRASCDIKMCVCYLCFTLLCCKRLRVQKSNRNLEKIDDLLLYMSEKLYQDLEAHLFCPHW